MASSKIKCKQCSERKDRESFEVDTPMLKLCSSECQRSYAENHYKSALDKVRKQKEREKAKVEREDKARLKVMKASVLKDDRSHWLKKAQQEFNKYIRLRDQGKPCISCDKPDNGNHQRHASHYRSVGACSKLRFNEDNVHASCAQCNTHNSGNIVEYRIRLIKKLGAEKVEWLECQNQPTKYSCDELRVLVDLYRKKQKDWH